MVLSCSSLLVLFSADIFDHWNNDCHDHEVHQRKHDEQSARLII